MRTLIIVESPAKARTLGNFLSKGYAVKASVGHIRDLPPREIGVHVDNDFRPTYVIVEGKQDVVAGLKKAAKLADTVVLVMDLEERGYSEQLHAHVILPGSGDELGEIVPFYHSKEDESRFQKAVRQ